MEGHGAFVAPHARADSCDQDLARRPPPSNIKTGLSTGVAIHLQMTPPETPVSSHDRPEYQLAPALFHNYLRALYPFDPASTFADSVDDESLLMTASIRPGDLILVHSIHANGWADGIVLTSGERGWLPTNYCEAFDHPYLRNLLNALTQFWDLLGANEDANLSAFVRQDYVRGLIAGVRYLLEHADCLHRDAALVQQYTGIRRMRKGLLGDLSTLVQIAKSLQETISEPFAGEVIHFLPDDVMAKAFKVVTRAVGFVDMWSKETTENKLVPGSQSTTRESVNPVMNVQKLKIDNEASGGIEIPDQVDSAKFLPPAAERHGDKQAMAGAEVEMWGEHAQLPSLSAAFKSRKSSLKYRPSVLKSERPPHGTLASEQLARVHDLCISHIGAFIGHHLHARSSSELVDTTDRLLKACKDMLVVVDEVYSHDPQRSIPVQHARTDFQRRLEELAMATKDSFKFSEIEGGQMITMPDQSNRLVIVGTNLIRTAGECVARTRFLIEQLGDFELDDRPNSADRAVQSGGNISRSSTKDDQADSPHRVMTCFENGLSRKILPPPLATPQRAPGVAETLDFALASPAMASDTTTLAIPDTAGLHRSLPPGPQRRSAVRLSQATAISGAHLRRPHSAKTDPVSPVRKDSVGFSITGSVDTYRSSIRDSGTVSYTHLTLPTKRIV